MPEQIANNQHRLLATLQQLLEIEGTELSSAMSRASDLISNMLHVDKVDAFLYEPSHDSLVAVGVSNTPMGIRQCEIGLDRLPIANGGRTVETYLTGTTYCCGRVHEDTVVLEGIRQGLGVRSMIVAPILVNGARPGVLSVTSTEEDRFSEDDLHFVEAVAHWVGILVHRAELVERIAQDAAERGRRAAAVELITVLAHDLGNYVTPLKGRLDLIRRRASRDGRQQDIDHLDAATGALRRIQRLIGELLDASRLEQGLFSLQTEPVNVAELARDTAGLLLIPDSHIEVNGPEELIAEADENRLRQALENLISNAVEHSPAGVPIRVEVRREQRDDGGWAVISVRDEGPGIPPDILPVLFTRFMKGINSRGLGLGLYVARGIAEAHGGNITVDSALGRGSTFSLSLPSTG